MWTAFLIAFSAVVQAQMPSSTLWVQNMAAPNNGVDTTYCGAVRGCVNATSNALASGSPAVFYMQVFQTNTQDPSKSKIQTAAFYPTVDVYSELIIPLMKGPQMAQMTSGTTHIDVQMVMMYNNQMFKSGLIAFTDTRNEIVCVPARTLVINLNQGIPFLTGGMQWSSTNCALTACECVDMICAYDCNSAQVGALTVRIGWTGTDSNGRAMTSLGSDIWHFQNAI
ncbi:hypothetical protein HDU98_012126 [Podochytrium sp. JEL0797]|nr:hypothetical protein HDU98_012126 [Podochytrium sp. JEL0797]